MNGSFSLKQLIDDMGFEVVYLAKGYEEVEIESNELNRPGLQLFGYFRKYVSERIQIIGGAEWQFCNDLTHEKRYQVLEPIFASHIPVMIFSRGNTVFDEAIDLAKKYNRTILTTKATTSRLVNQLINYTDVLLAPSMRVHGILMDIYGVGVLLTGPSGVGKSETALDLLVNGHKLISDDSVIIRRLDEQLHGTSPKVTQHFMEIRGVGIIDVQRIFGVGCVMEEKEIDLIVHLEPWNENISYDRLGEKSRYGQYLGIEVPLMTIPVKSGRNTSMVIEVATKNFKLKDLGYNAALALNDRLTKEINRRKKNH